MVPVFQMLYHHSIQSTAPAFQMLYHKSIEYSTSIPIMFPWFNRVEPVLPMLCYALHTWIEDVTTYQITFSIFQIKVSLYWRSSRCEKSVIGCIIWCVGGCESFSQSPYTHYPEQTVAYCNWLELWEFIKFTVQT